MEQNDVVVHEAVELGTLRASTPDQMMVQAAVFA